MEAHELYPDLPPEEAEEALRRLNNYIDLVFSIHDRNTREAIDQLPNDP